MNDVAPSTQTGVHLVIVKGNGIAGEQRATIAITTQESFGTVKVAGVAQIRVVRAPASVTTAIYEAAQGYSLNGYCYFDHNITLDDIKRALHRHGIEVVQ